MRERLAKLTYSILNPFLVSLVVLILLAFKATANTADAGKWAAIAVVLSVLPVFTVVVYLARHGKLDGIFVNPREQRTGIYLLASGLAIIGCAVMWYFGAPELLLATFCAGLAAVVAFMVINLFWKISLHTAFISGSVTVLTIVYGATGAWFFLLLPAVAWARIETEQHSPTQVASGALLAGGIVVLVFWGFGLVG